MKRSGLDATVATNSENGDERPRYLAHMGIEIRVCPPDRFRELLKLAGVAFSEDVPDDLVERVERVADRERFFTALDAEQMVATSGVFTMRMSVPGGEMPAGGVTWVTVLPSHRRRGLMSGMMRLMIDDCHSRGEPIAILWAAEGAIYQRFGFGLASFSYSLEAETKSVGFAREWEPEGVCRFVPAGEGLDLVAPIYDVARTQRSGFLARPPDWWTGILPRPEIDAKAGEVKRLVVYETAAGPEAYAVYKAKADWNARGPAGVLTVEEAIGATPRGTREIWRFLLDVDLIRTLKAGRLPADHALFHLAAEPRRLGTSVGDGLWLRIVDVAPALEGRSYGLDGAANGRLTFDLRDDYCPWNAGRWTLDVEQGRAGLKRSSVAANIALDASDLGALLLGGVGATGLGLAGRVVELTAGGLGLADRLFRTALDPWCPQEF
jgi:predicted acetyltransferase